MKFLILFLSLIMVSCENRNAESIRIENEINNSIIESLKYGNESLIEDINQLYHKDIIIKKMNNISDYENFISIINEVQRKGDFGIIDTSLMEETKELRRKLDSLNFYSADYLNFKFLSKAIKPTIIKHQDYYKTELQNAFQKDLIYNIGVTNLDTMSISYTLYLLGLRENLDKMKLKDKAYYNIILLTTYGNFIFYTTENTATNSTYTQCGSRGTKTAS